MPSAASCYLRTEWSVSQASIAVDWYENWMFPCAISGSAPATVGCRATVRGIDRRRRHRRRSAVVPVGVAGPQRPLAVERLRRSWRRGRPSARTSSGHRGRRRRRRPLASSPELRVGDLRRAAHVGLVRAPERSRPPRAVAREASASCCAPHMWPALSIAPSVTNMPDQSRASSSDRGVGDPDVPAEVPRLRGRIGPREETVSVLRVEPRRQGGQGAVIVGAVGVDVRSARSTVSAM